MSEKRYQISPIELVQWAEPLFGFGEGKATGFSEKTVASYEAAAGIRLPAALREYYLACGMASLNCALHEIFVPDKKAKPFKKRLTFSYDHIDEDLETFSKPGEEDYPELAKIRALPRERWCEVTGNYLSAGGVDFRRLCEPYPFPGGRFCHTCLDPEANTLYVYGEEAEGRLAYLKVFKPDEEE